MDDEDIPISEEEAISRVRVLLRRDGPRWEGDVGSTADKIAEEIYDRLKLTTRLKTGLRIKTQKKDLKFAIIDLIENYDLIRDDESRPVLFENENEAREHARKHYGESSDGESSGGVTDDFLDAVVIEWPDWDMVVGLQGQGGTFSLDSDEILEDEEERSAHLKSVSNSIKDIIIGGYDPKDTGMPAHSEYTSLEHYQSHVRSLREERLEKRIENLDLNHVRGTGETEWRLVGEDARDKIEYEDVDRPELKKGPLLKQQTMTDYELARLVLLVLVGQDKALETTVADVLGHAHVWRREHPLIEAGAMRDRLRAPEDTGIRSIVEGMISNHFDIQLLFEREQCVGSIELKTISEYVARRGWDRLEGVVASDVKRLKKLGIWSPAPPTVSALTPLHRVLQFLMHGVDAVLFEWNLELDGSDPPGIAEQRLEEGLHIITSHDVLAFRMPSGPSD